MLSVGKLITRKKLAVVAKRRGRKAVAALGKAQKAERAVSILLYFEPQLILLAQTNKFTGP